MSWRSSTKPTHGATDDIAGAAIIAERVTKRYGAVAALHDVSLAVAPGQAVALWGPNGAGKTTLIRCLLGLARYTGEIRIAGIDPARDGCRAREVVGYVPQELPVAPVTVGELVAFIATIRRAPVDAGLERLEQFGIGDALDKRVGELSGGMRQRLALGLALIGAPRMLFLDEPTANLDAAGRADVLDLLRELKREGMTFVFSSHRPEDVLALADRVLLIERGELRRDATPAEFQAELGAASRLVVTLTNGHLPEALSALRELGYEATGAGHVLTVPIAPGEKARVLSHLAREGVDIADFEVERRA